MQQSVSGKSPSFSLDELCALVELPIRTVRYYIQIGLVDRPQGETRGARYGSRHVEQLLTVRKWTQAGLSLDRIAELMASKENPEPPLAPRRPGSVEVWSRLLIAEGVELHIEPTRAGLNPERVRALLRQAMTSFENVKKKSNTKDSK